MKCKYLRIVFLLLYAEIAWSIAIPDAQARPLELSGNHLFPARGNPYQLPVPQKFYEKKQPGIPPFRLAVDARLTENSPGDKTAGNRTSLIFDVTSARKLNIRFLGYKELTGEYSVNADATVSIPVLGRISVAKMDAAELERILSQKVTLHTGRKGYATVEVITYKPVFVTGHVKQPKSYDWVPGMTVLHAITLAGGIGTGNMGGMNLPLSKNNENSRLQQAGSNLKHLLAILTRLYVEKSHKNHITVSEELVRLVGKPEAIKLAAAQYKIHKNVNKYFKNQVNIVKEAISAAKQELKIMKLQEKKVRQQIKLQHKRRRLLNAMKKRKLVSNKILLDLETKLVDIEAKSITAMVARANLRGRLLDLQRELLKLTHKRQTSINNRIFKLEQDAARERIILETARKALRAMDNSSRLSGIGGNRQENSYEIVREFRQGVRNLVASHFTRLQPGDIIVIN